MCNVRDDFVHLSYRAGRRYRAPAGRSDVPLVVFALSLAGSAGVRVKVDAHCHRGAGFLDQENGTATQDRWSEEFYVPPGYFRRQPIDLGVKEEGVQANADYRYRSVVSIQGGSAPTGAGVEVDLELVMRGWVREDEDFREDLEALLSKTHSDHFSLYF